MSHTAWYKTKMKSNHLPAGNFSSWLRQMRQPHAPENSGMDVPCGACTACCTSSLFIHIKPHETKTLKSIPKNLVFPAPGLPKGNVLMGYDENGKCPMFRENKCSIYDSRPQTCRDFDCRIFAATGIYMDETMQASIVERSKHWRFDFDGDESKADHEAVLASAKFLMEQTHLFPDKALPKSPSQLALLAIKVYRHFREHNHEANGKAVSDTEIAKRILAEIAHSRRE